ncbi:MFS transporter [Streptomyces iconiensis]|uniref:MFS transporter n=1 Tax=Streptomyces iconiensis TaxID=1384038 RepID=A0ABT6ZQC0_9ACTN|nr:MFS transporter [Streptomyces iconiensis]MDJ1131252.1 MFS transporter [Streptomyces iconiensis]
MAHDVAVRRAVPSQGTRLVLACTAQLMVVLDVSVVNVALPSMEAALGLGESGTQWVVSGYLLAFGGLLLLGGRLADVYGHKRAFLAGLALFSAVSLAGGLATNPGTLIAARVGQGLGAAVLAPATLTLLTTAFPEGQRRTRALATWTAVSVGGAAAGNLISGLLTAYASWRWTLLINVPIGAVTAILAARIPASSAAGRGRERPRLDIPGAVAATLGLLAFIHGLGLAQSHGWLAPDTLVALALGGVLLAAFVLIEARLARVPLVPLRLLRMRTIVVGNVVMLLAGACFQAPMWYFLTFYMQRVLHYDTVQTGLSFLPHTLVTIAVGWRLTPWLMRHTDARTLVIAGALLGAAGFWWQSRISADTGYLTGILGPALVFSTGGGLLNTPLTTVVTSGVEADDAGAASGLMNTAKQVGGSLGLAALVALTATSDHTPRALAAAYADAFWISALFLAAVAVTALALPPQRHSAPSSSPATTAE